MSLNCTSKMFRVVESHLRTGLSRGRLPWGILRVKNNRLARYVSLYGTGILEDHEGTVTPDTRTDKNFIQGVQGPIIEKGEINIEKARQKLDTISQDAELSVNEKWANMQGIQGQQETEDLDKFRASENLMSLSSHVNQYVPEATLPSDDPQLSSYTTGESVDLSGMMCANVPEPYGKNPPSINMPRGQVFQHQKYISGNMIDVMHPNRKFHSSAIRKAVPDHERTFPQGIQGSADEDVEMFELWLKNCREYHLRDCDQQLKDIQSGKKTLSQIFDEQDQLIRKVALDYGKDTMDLNHSKSSEDGSIQGVQGQIKEQLVEKIRDLMDNPSPQGIQGDDNCVRFKLWLQNCAKYGLANCDDQLQGVQTGRKTLSQIFQEQDEIIEKVVRDYAASGSLGSKPKVGIRHYSTSPSSVDPPKLSQKERLKRAVKEYGATVVVFHVGISLMSLGGFYVAVSSGLDVIGMLKAIGVGESILESRLAAGASTFVVAYAVHKVFAPVRIAITLTSTPLIVHRLRRIGFLKPPSQKPS